MNALKRDMRGVLAMEGRAPKASFTNKINYDAWSEVKPSLSVLIGDRQTLRAPKESVMTDGNGEMVEC
jgi:hypothetical protein